MIKYLYKVCDFVSTNYMNDFYKQFEEISNKLDKANETIHIMSVDMSLLRAELKQERDSHNKDKEKIQELTINFRNRK